MTLTTEQLRACAESFGLDFIIENRSGIWVKEWFNNGCTVATAEEVMLWSMLANREAQPVELHMGVAMEVFDTLRDAKLSSRVEHSELGAMGETKIEVWSSKIGALLEMHHGNGGCTLKVFIAPPAPAVPDAISTRQAIVNMESHEPCDSINVAYKHGWNDFRASMLNHLGDTNEKDQPVSQGYKLPDGWVACSERMPDDGVVVLCCEGGDISTLFYRGNGIWDDGDFHSHITGITHWMPLPAAPEGGK